MTKPVPTLETKSYFATAIGEASLDDPSLLLALEEAIWSLEADDAAGATWCDEEGYDGYTSYASLDDLPNRNPAFAELVEHLTPLAQAFSQTLCWNLDGQALELDSLWVNILGEGGSHSGHIHPASVLSGTVYISMPKGAGALKFEDPRLPLMMAAPQPDGSADDAHRRFVYRQPPAGTVLFWESWLRHEVMPNRSDEPRLTISFNYGLRP